jgi:hypothetical protein
VPAGIVLEQSPLANTFVAPGSSVSIVVSSGPAPNPAVDTMTSSDGSGAQTTLPFNTSGPGEVLVAFAASDGPFGTPQTLTVSGAGLNWTLVTRANALPGTAEIWRAIAPTPLSSVTVQSIQSMAGGYHQSLTVVAFASATNTGAFAGTSASSSTPSVSLVTTAPGSLVFGIGNDWDNAVARTVSPDQTIIHQWIDATSGDTYWVQAFAAPVASAGSTVFLNDTIATTDRWNYAAVEVIH